MTTDATGPSETDIEVAYAVNDMLNLIAARAGARCPGCGERGCRNKRLECDGDGIDHRGTRSILINQLCDAVEELT